MGRFLRVAAAFLCLIHAQVDASEKLNGTSIIKGEEAAHLLSIIEFQEVEYHNQLLSVVIRDVSASLASREWTAARPKLTVSPKADTNRTFNFQGKKVSLRVLLASIARQSGWIVTVDETGIRIMEEAP